MMLLYTITLLFGFPPGVGGIAITHDAIHSAWFRVLCRCRDDDGMRYSVHYYVARDALFPDARACIRDPSGDVQQYCVSLTQYSAGEVVDHMPFGECHSLGCDVDHDPRFVPMTLPPLQLVYRPTVAPRHVDIGGLGIVAVRRWALAGSCMLEVIRMAMHCCVLTVVMRLIMFWILVMGMRLAIRVTGALVDVWSRSYTLSSMPSLRRAVVGSGSGGLAPMGIPIVCSFPPLVGRMLVWRYAAACGRAAAGASAQSCRCTSSSMLPFWGAVVGAGVGDAWPGPSAARPWPWALTSHALVVLQGLMLIVLSWCAVPVVRAQSRSFTSSSMPPSRQAVVDSGSLDGLHTMDAALPVTIVYAVLEPILLHVSPVRALADVAASSVRAPSPPLCSTVSPVLCFALVLFRTWPR